MKKLDTKKSLSLSTETVRTLSEDQLAAIAGGADLTYKSCPSVQICYSLDPGCPKGGGGFQVSL